MGADRSRTDADGAEVFAPAPGATQQRYYYYADIYILIEAIENYDDLVQLRKMYDIWTTIKQRGPRSQLYSLQNEEPVVSPNSPKLKPLFVRVPDDKPSSPESQLMGAPFDYRSEVNFEDIMQSLNGFARIIKYRCCPAPGSYTNPLLMNKKDLEVLTVEEGIFRKGKKSGYCRVFDGQSGMVECGFFKNDLPSGKYVKWGPNQIEKMEGIYKGRSIASNIEIKSFVFNVETSY